MNYDILRTYQIGQVVRNGQPIVDNYEHICTGHDKAVKMENRTSFEDNTMTWYVECPECGITVLEGFHEEN